MPSSQARNITSISKVTSCIVGGGGLQVTKGNCGKGRKGDKKDGETAQQAGSRASLALVGFEARENRDDGAKRWQRWSGHNMRGEGAEFGLHKVGYELAITSAALAVVPWARKPTMTERLTLAHSMHVAHVVPARVCAGQVTTLRPAGV